jgi:hypothetical protein
VFHRNTLQLPPHVGGSGRDHRLGIENLRVECVARGRCREQSLDLDPRRVAMAFLSIADDVD